MQEDSISQRQDSPEWCVKGTPPLHPPGGVPGHIHRSSTDQGILKGNQSYATSSNHDLLVNEPVLNTCATHVLKVQTWKTQTQQFGRASTQILQLPNPKWG